MNYNNLIFYYCIMNLNEDELKQVNESLTQQLNPRFNPNMVMDNVKSAGEPKPSLEHIVNEVVNTYQRIRLKQLSNEQAVLLKKINDISLEKVKTVKNGVVSLLNMITDQSFTLHVSGGKKKKTRKRKVSKHSVSKTQRRNRF